jgi:competence protein ComEC
MKTKNLIKILIGSLAIICFLIGFTYYSQGERQNLEVDFLNVGQGDSILIKTPYNQNILVDGGPDNSVLSELGKNLSFYDKNIDLIILSHPHSDHVTGLVEILRRYRVKKVIMTGIVYSASYYNTFLDEIKNQNIETEIVKGPEDINLGDNLEIKILYPPSDISGQTFKNANNESIVAKLIYFKEAFLLTGDAESPVEEQLIDNKVDLSADVLKVPHHGSCISLDQKVIDAVRPKEAVISVGVDNKYGHPCAQTLDLLNNDNIPIFRTDILGTLKFVSDGQTIRQK